MEKYFHFDRSKTLEELDEQNWGEPNYYSHVVTKCHELRKKPIGMFSVEDVRIMIGQNLNLDIVVPLAIELVDDDILAQGDFYSGDLLDTLLKVDVEFWNDNRHYKEELERIITRNIEYFTDKLTRFHTL